MDLMLVDHSSMMNADLMVVALSGQSAEHWIGHSSTDYCHQLADSLESIVLVEVVVVTTGGVAVAGGGADVVAIARHVEDLSVVAA